MLDKRKTVMKCPNCSGEAWLDKSEFIGIIYKCRDCKRSWIIKEVTKC